MSILSGACGGASGLFLLWRASPCPSLAFGLKIAVVGGSFLGGDAIPCYFSGHLQNPLVGQRFPAVRALHAVVNLPFVTAKGVESRGIPLDLGSRYLVLPDGQLEGCGGVPPPLGR